MRKTFICGGAAAAMSLLLAAPAWAGAITVAATTDIWLAGQPDGTVATGNFGSDVAPDNSPVLISTTGGTTFTFAASGSTSVDGGCFAGPDGGCYPDESSFGVGPANGIGTYQGPSDALIGVFLDASTPSGTGGPASLDFTDPSVVSLAGFTPLLNQIFFIGDGLTGPGDGSGSVQTFLAPTGATRLYLAVADSYGSSTGNLGSLDVTYDATGGVPEPAAWALMLAGFGLTGAALRRRRTLAAA